MPAHLTLECETTGKKFFREINPLSEFYSGNEEFRLREIADWIRDRGNPQHATSLKLVSYFIQ